MIEVVVDMQFHLVLSLQLFPEYLTNIRLSDSCDVEKPETREGTSQLSVSRPASKYSQPSLY